MLTRRFPLSASLRRASQTLIVISSVGWAASSVAAVNGTKPAAPPRPVARLISTSKQEVPARVRERLGARSSYTPAAAVPVAATDDERRTFELINAERLRRGLGPLVFDASLTRMARYHSENMAHEDFFHHIDRDGLDLTGRAQALGISGWKVLGENIAYNQGYEDPSAFVVERWMISAKHRANILSGEFTHAGLGIARAADGRVFFTQVFMRR